MLRKAQVIYLMLCICATSLFAQNKGNASINLANVTLKEFFQEVESKCGYTFMYSNEDIDDSRSVTVASSTQDINGLLSQALKSKSINYEIASNQIILTKSEKQVIAQAKQESTRKITGKIVDTDQEPVIGAAIVVAGTTIGTATDVDGNFMLDIPTNAKNLNITYVGFISQNIAIGSKTQFDIMMKESDLALEEVVVIGYGTLKKKDLTAAISTVDSDKIGSKAATNPAEALQGLVSGVNVLKSDGLAGSGVSIRIRGVNTFGSNEPLYVIDGFPGDIDNLNPNDIASIEILKDGAASAIYGSVAANGVVIVTTKGGQKDKVTVDLNSYVSVRKVARQLKMLDAKGYVQVHKQMYEAANEDLPSYVLNPGDYNTDWQDAIFRTGVSLNQSVSVRGGFKDTKFAMSGNITDDKGIIIKNDFTKQNVRAKISTKKNIFTIEGNIGYRASKYKNHNVSLKEAYMISPLVPIYDENTEGGYGLTNSYWTDLPGNTNVIANSDNVRGGNKRQNFSGNFALGVDIYKGLNFRTSYGYRSHNYKANSHYPKFTAHPKEPKEYPYASDERSFWEEQTFDNVLSYNKEIKEHSFNAMIGTSMKKEQSDWNSIAVEGKRIVHSVQNGKLIIGTESAGFPDQSFGTIDAGKGGTFSGDGSKYKYNRMSYFGRLNYSYSTRYLFQFTMRRDGSSKFGANRRWGNFPSLAAGWRITEEAFFPKNTAVSNLKLRGSWGKLGNEVALSYYDSHALISTNNTNWLGSVQGGNPWPGSIATGLEDKDLRWETTESINIGLDYGFFDNKLNGTINYYSHNTKDLLIMKRLAPSAGLTNPVLNVGEIRNSGLELEVNYADKVGEFNYNVGMNLSYLKNEVRKLSDPKQILDGDGVLYGDTHVVNKTQIGYPIGAFFLYETDGIFQNDAEVAAHVNKEGKPLQKHAKPGDIRFKDTNDDGVIDESDKTYQGTGMPKVEVNLSLGASFKGFDLSALIGSGWGHKLYNANRYFYEGMQTGSNFMRSTLGAWTEDRPSNSMPRAVLGDPNGNTRESNRFLEDADFIRLRQLQIGYTLPKTVLKMLRLDNLRLYVSGENLATWSKYKGIDPEFSSSTPLNIGVDRHIFPFTRAYVFGMQVSF